jgi:hypothetical protein
MKTTMAIMFVCLLILIADTITGADIGKPTWRLGKESGNMRECLVSVPLRNVVAGEAVTVTVHIIGAAGELAQGMLTDVMLAPGDGILRRTFQIRNADASTIVRIDVER